ncbi:MAG: hypothetical protein WCT46_06015 [Candidatus Gracilibacteria bacterium]|jgi:hypothetical protein
MKKILIPSVVTLGIIAPQVAHANYGMTETDFLMLLLIVAVPILLFVLVIVFGIEFLIALKRKNLAMRRKFSILLAIALLLFFLSVLYGAR